MWEEIEVTDRQTFFTNSSPLEKFKLPRQSACFAQEGENNSLNRFKAELCSNMGGGL